MVYGFCQYRTRALIKATLTLTHKDDFFCKIHRSINVINRSIFRGYCNQSSCLYIHIYAFDINGASIDLRIVSHI